MRKKSNFEIVKIGDDYTLVPVADRIESFKGMVILNDVSAYLLENMQEDKSEKELVQLLINEFDVDQKTAESDIHEMLIEIQIPDQESRLHGVLEPPSRSFRATFTE